MTGAARGYDLADAGDVDGALPGVHDVHAVADLALHDHLAGDAGVGNRILCVWTYLAPKRIF